VRATVVYPLILMIHYGALSGDKLVNKYLVVKELGKGATGEVYMVRDEETGQPYAMKVTNRYAAGWSDENAGDRAIAQEIAVMKKLQHQNIVNLIEVRRSACYFFNCLHFYRSESIRS
jgi:serine/threonine protein kinase